MDIRKTAKASVMLAVLFLAAFGAVYAQEGAAAEQGRGSISDKGMIALAATLSLGIASIAAAYGIAHAGSAAMAAMAEKPEIATWAVIIVALAEGLALYGLVIAFMIIGKI